MREDGGREGERREREEEREGKGNKSGRRGGRRGDGIGLPLRKQTVSSIASFNFHYLTL